MAHCCFNESAALGQLESNPRLLAFKANVRTTVPTIKYARRLNGTLRKRQAIVSIRK